MKRPEIVKRVAEILRHVAPEARCILYGSEARGDARPDSDIDVLVVLPDDKVQGSFARRKIDIIQSFFDVELETGVSISPLVVLQSMWEQRRTPFTVNVANEGIEI